MTHAVGKERELNLSHSISPSQGGHNGCARPKAVSFQNPTTKESVVKRSLLAGFAGIPNPLFATDNTMMLFGDGKKMIVDVAGALKEL